MNITGPDMKPYVNKLLSCTTTEISVTDLPLVYIIIAIVDPIIEGRVRTPFSGSTSSTCWCLPKPII